MMSEEKVPPLNHPFLYLLTGMQYDVWEAYKARNYNECVYLLSGIVCNLEDSIQRKMEPFLNEAEMYINNPKLPCFGFFMKFWRYFSKCIHNAGYFTAAKAKPFRITDLGAIRDESKHDRVNI